MYLMQRFTENVIVAFEKNSRVLQFASVLMITDHRHHSSEHFLKRGRTISHLSSILTQVKPMLRSINCNKASTAALLFQPLQKQSVNHQLVFGRPISCSYAQSQLTIAYKEALPCIFIYSFILIQKGNMGLAHYTSFLSPDVT